MTYSWDDSQFGFASEECICSFTSPVLTTSSAFEGPASVQLSLQTLARAQPHRHALMDGHCAGTKAAASVLKAEGYGSSSPVAALAHAGGTHTVPLPFERKVSSQVPGQPKVTHSTGCLGCGRGHIGPMRLHFGVVLPPPQLPATAQYRTFLGFRSRSGSTETLSWKVRLRSATA